MHDHTLTGVTPAQFADPDTKISYLATGLLRSAPDVGTGLRDLVQHLDLHDRGGVPTLSSRGNTTQLGYAIHQPGTKAADQIYDLSIALGCNIFRSLCGEKCDPTEVLLSHRVPQDQEPYRRFFRAPFRFNADQNAVTFPTRWLDQRIPSAAPLLARHLEQEAAVLHELQKMDIVSELRGLLHKSLIAGESTAGGIARQLCVHERTLNRRLREEGTSFQRQLDNVRYAMARQYLAESTMPITRIAAVLSYADVRAFSRAFKRWSGMTPAEWRSRNAASP